MAFEDQAPAPTMEVTIVKDPRTIKSLCLEDPINVGFDLSNMALKFNLDHSSSHVISSSNQIHSSSNGNKRPTLRDGKPFRFVLQP